MSAIIARMVFLRRSRFLARLVLAWFVLSLGAAVASPIVAPQGLEVICSSAGVMKVLVRAADGSVSEVSKPMLDCPACAAPVAAPPPVVGTQVVPPQPLAYALQSLPSAHIAARIAAPLPARGPPASS